MDFYKQHQYELLKFINSSYGREYLDITNPAKAVKVTPNSIHFYVGKNTFQAIFKTYNFIDQKVRPYIEIAHYEKPTLLDDSYQLINAIHLNTATFSPAAGGSGSGRLNSNNATFANARSGSNINLVTSIAQLDNILSGGVYNLDHDYTPFVTSSLTSLAKLVSAFIRYKGSAGTADADSFALIVVQSLQASFTTLAANFTDWLGIGSTSFGSITAASWNASGNNDISLNASGIANISLTGTSGFAAIGNRDFNNAAPTGTNVLGISQISDIVLSVTYSLPGGGSFLLNFC